MCQDASYSFSELVPEGSIEVAAIWVERIYYESIHNPISRRENVAEYIGRHNLSISDETLLEFYHVEITHLFLSGATMKIILIKHFNLFSKGIIEHSCLCESF